MQYADYPYLIHITGTANVRTIFIIIAIIGILFVVRQMLASRQSGAKTPDQNVTHKPDVLTECSQCGLHLPADEAIRQGEESFCCIEHLNAHKNHE